MPFPHVASEEVQVLRSALGSLCASRPEIAAVYLFGSVARGDARADSDLDLGLVFSRRHETALDRQQLIARLAYEIGKHTARERVDLVVLEPQGPIFCHRVLCEGRLIYEGDRDRRIDFESETLVRAFDFRPTYELATRGKERALRDWLAKRYDLR